MNKIIKNINFSYDKSVLILFLALYLIRFFSGRCLHTIALQPIKSPEIDYAFWLLLLTQIPSFLINHSLISLIVDIIILFLSIYLVIKFKKYLFIILITLFFIQHITVEIYSCYHSKVSVVIFVAFIPLLLKQKNKHLMIEFVRYFVLFILVSAAYHKIHNGAIFSLQYFQTVLFLQHIDLQVLNPNHISYKIAVYLRSHIYYAYTAFMLLFFTQLSFALGIFTKKLDLLLILLLITFTLMTYLVMRIYIFELLIAIPAFLYFKQKKHSLFFPEQTT